MSNSPTLEDALEWIASGHSLYSGDVPRLRKTALKKLCFAPGDGEKSTVTSVLQQQALLLERWVREHPGKLETGKTYLFRVKRTLEDFLLWQESPIEYEQKQTNKTRDKVSTKEKVAKTDVCPKQKPSRTQPRPGPHLDAIGSPPSPSPMAPPPTAGRERERQIEPNQAKTARFSLPLAKDGSQAVVELPLPIDDAHLEHVQRWLRSTRDGLS